MLETNFLLRLTLANPWQHKVAGLQPLKGPPQSPQEHSPCSASPSLVQWLCNEVFPRQPQYPGPWSPAFSRSSVQREPKLNHGLLGKALTSVSVST